MQNQNLVSFCFRTTLHHPGSATIQPYFFLICQKSTFGALIKLLRWIDVHTVIINQISRLRHIKGFNVDETVIIKALTSLMGHLHLKSGSGFESFAHQTPGLHGRPLYL